MLIIVRRIIGGLMKIIIIGFLTLLLLFLILFLMCSLYLGKRADDFFQNKNSKN